MFSSFTKTAGREHGRVVPGAILVYLAAVGPAIGMVGPGEVRDAELARARSARHDYGLLDEKTDDRGRPGPLDSRAIAISCEAYAAALVEEARRADLVARGHLPAAGPLSFATIWNEAMANLLGCLDRWPELWRTNLATGADDVYLPFHVLALCASDTFRGEEYMLPRDQLPRRMASLPDSLARVRLDEGRCRAAADCGCAALAASLVARSADLDALTGFRNGRAYWAFPAGEAPRSAGRDRIVASSTLGYVDGLLSACSATRVQAGIGALSEQAARSLLAATGRLWPPETDPFRTIPGLRNPRADRSGHLVCDVVMYKDCLEATPERAQRWLQDRIGEGGRVIAADH